MTGFQRCLLLIFSCFILASSSQMNNSSPRISDYWKKSVGLDEHLFDDLDIPETSIGFWAGNQLLFYLWDPNSDDKFFESLDFKYFGDRTVSKGIVILKWQKVDDQDIVFRFDLQIFDERFPNIQRFHIPFEFRRSLVAPTNKNTNGSDTFSAPDPKINPNTVWLYVDPLGSMRYSYKERRDGLIYELFGKDIQFFFIEKDTRERPQIFNTSDLKSYALKFRFSVTPYKNPDHFCYFITSAFYESLAVSLQDKMIPIVGSLIYLLVSIFSMHPPSHRILKITFVLLISFKVYMLFIIFGVTNSKIVSDNLYYLLPIATVIILDIIKHIIECTRNYLYESRILGILASYMLINAVTNLFKDPYQVLILGDYLSSLCLLPHVIKKYEERHHQSRHLTRFEVGNWICISLWMFYTRFYPKNIFFLPESPISVKLFSIAIFIQFVILVCLQYAVRRENHDYTFVAQDAKEKEMLQETECAVCKKKLTVNPDETVYKTPCEHFFHEECLKQWALRSLNCPVCQVKFPEFISSARAREKTD